MIPTEMMWQGQILMGHVEIIGTDFLNSSHYIEIKVLTRGKYDINVIDVNYIMHLGWKSI